MRSLCCNCGRVRDRELDQWTGIYLTPVYVSDMGVVAKTYGSVEDSHGICPACIKKLYPSEYETMEKEGYFD